MNKKDIINALAAEIKDAGYRVFIAHNGEYGFYTNSNGDRVISFQLDFCYPIFSGNYVTNLPTQTGTGWRIQEGTKGGFTEIFNAIPPQFAVGKSKWRFATLKDHLNRYQQSSKYSEV